MTSDSCSAEACQDNSGEYVVSQLRCNELFSDVFKHIVPDDIEKITKCIELCLSENSALIITVGGTGLCPRDVTPDASKTFYEKDCPGIAHALMKSGLESCKQAALSRLTAGIAKQCLIVNFPGKLKACIECYDSLKDILKHALEQVRYDLQAIKSTHRDQDSDAEYHDRSRLPECKIESISEEQNGDHLKEPPAPRPSKADHTHKTESPYPLIEFEDALKILKKESENLELTKVDMRLESVDDANQLLGHRLADNLNCKVRLPPYSVSTMDGYVLNVSKLLRKFTSNIGTVNALILKDLDEFIKMQEDKSQEVSNAFFCYQVNTGGKIPDRDFAIIPFEFTKPNPPDRVIINRVEPEKYIRAIGSDLDYCDKLEKGTTIGPVELGLIMAFGHNIIPIIKKPIIGVISTGDELINFLEENPPSIHKVIDLNKPILISLIKERGYEAIDFGISRDSSVDILLKVLDSLSKCDILVVTGGASMGSKDYVKSVIEKSLGGNIHFGRVNIKPGKPAAFASIQSGGKQKYIFSLPGNPVSAYVTAIVLLFPFISYSLGRRSGRNMPDSVDIVGTLINVKVEDIIDVENDECYVFDGRLDFLRAKFSCSNNDRLKSPYPVHVSLKQQSSRLINLKNADCLILADPVLKGSKFRVGQTYQALQLKY